MEFGFFIRIHTRYKIEVYRAEKHFPFDKSHVFYGIKGKLFLSNALNGCKALSAYFFRNVLNSMERSC